MTPKLNHNTSDRMTPASRLLVLTTLAFFAALFITTAYATIPSLSILDNFEHNSQSSAQLDDVAPEEILTTITPISVNSTQAFFLISAVFPLTCPIDPSDGGDTPVGEFRTAEDPIWCSPSQFTFAPPPHPEPEPKPDPEPPTPIIANSLDGVQNDEADPEPLTTILPITMIDLTLFADNLVNPLMTAPQRIEVKSNATGVQLNLQQMKQNSQVFLNMMVSFDLSKARYVMTDFPQFIATLVFADTLNPGVIKTYTMNLKIPLQPPLGQMKAIAEYRHYSIISQQSHDTDLGPDRNQIYTQEVAVGIDSVSSSSSKMIEQYKEDPHFDPLADQRSVNIHDILPLISIFNITVPRRKEGEAPNYKSLQLSTSGFLHFELVDHIGQVFRQQAIDCFVNNLKISPKILFDRGTGQTTTVSFDLPAALIDLLELSGSAAMISIQCPYQLVLMPRYPSLEVTSPHVAAFPYAITMDLVDSTAQRSFASTTTLFVPTNVFSMAQNSEFLRPISQLAIVNGYYDATMLYCQLTIAHEWNRSFGYQDLTGVFTSPGTPVASPLVLERRTSQISLSRQATPSTTSVPMALVESQTEESKFMFPLGEGSYTTGNIPLYADNVNKKAKDSAISLYASIPLKPEAVRAINEGKSNPIAQCGFSYLQQYGIKTRRSYTPTPNNQNDKQDESLENETGNGGEIVAQSKFTSTATTTKYIRGIIGVTDVPSPINTYSIATVTQVPYIQPVSATMSLNVTDTRGSVGFEVHLKDFTAPVDSGTIVLSFPSQSYIFSGDLLCTFNDFKMRGIGFNLLPPPENGDTKRSDEQNQGLDKGWFDIKFDMSGIETTFPKGSKIQIQCPNTVLIPAWNNYYYVKATVPFRVMVYKTSAQVNGMQVLDIPLIENLVASISTLQELPATKSYIVIAIVLSIIAFFFALTLLLTKLCDRLIDRLHKHRVHVYVKTDNHENENLFTSNQNLFTSNNNSGPRSQLTDSGNFSTQNFLTSSNVNYQVMDDSAAHSPGST